MDLTEAEDTKKKWQEYTQDLHDPDNHDGVITDLEPDILECEVKWALESITTNKASGSDGIPVELFQILKVSRRGGIVDVFPVDAEQPARIEFFGDEVETIRRFNPSTQRSERAANDLTFSPSREVS